MKKKISFCQTCRDRLWQLKETLGSNLRALDEDCEIMLVDYGSTDGLSTWVWQNHRSAIESRRLSFFEVRNKVRWSIPRAKNLAHRLSAGDYVFNLDADNFVAASDLKKIREMAEKELPCHQWSGEFIDGSFGRIGLSRRLFFEIGGYDEAMLPMGAQDMDLLRRLSAIGRNAVRIHGPASPAIANSASQKMASVIRQGTDEADAKRNFDEMNEANKMLSRVRLATEGPVRLGGFATFQGLLNGQMVIIDGFNRVRNHLL